MLQITEHDPGNCVRSIFSSLYLWHTGDYESSVSELMPSRWLYRVAPTTPGLLLPRLVLELCVTSDFSGCRLTNDFIARWHFPEMKDLIELQTFHTQDLSFPRTKGPYGELSFPRNESPGNFRSRGTKVPGNFRSWDLSYYPGTFIPIIR